MKTQRVLLLTLSFGSGHVQAARAVARELERQAPGAEVLVIDALANCSSLFRAGYVWPYWAMVRYAPALWGNFFARRVARADEHTAPEWAFRWGCSDVFESIARFNPDIIIAAEVAACEMAVMAKREGLTTAHIVNVITDYEAEPVWVKSEIDLYAVASDEVGDELRAWGAPIESIFTTGIPTDSLFSIRHDEKATRARYGVGLELPIVLLMGGGMGPTCMDEVAAELCASGEAMACIAVTGQNERARRRLSNLRPQPPATLRVVGWTDDIPALMQAASLLVTKPGGLTIAEAIECRLPIVMVDPIPGPEQRNAARLAEAGAGVLTDGARETVRSVLSLLRDEAMRQKMVERVADLARPLAAATIARLALNQKALMKEMPGEIIA